VKPPTPAEPPPTQEPKTEKADPFAIAKKMPDTTVKPAPEPTQETVRRKTSEPPAEKPAAPAEPAPAKRQAGPVNVMALPALKESDKERYGLSDIRINMLRPATKSRPYASAIINLRPVQVGERIPDTSAVLIAVESRAIGIEISGTGDRFHIRF
jgi:hypothetical protein